MTAEELLALAERYVDAQLATLAAFGSSVTLTSARRRELVLSAAAIVAPSWGIRLPRR